MKRLSALAVAATLALGPGLGQVSEGAEPRKPRKPRTPQPVEVVREAGGDGGRTRRSPTGRGHAAPAPTAPPAPTAQPSSVTERLTAAWPGDNAWVLRIARCESNFVPTAVSHANAVGILQVHWPSWSGLARSMGYSYADMKRIEPNVDVAWAVYQSQGPGAWVCH